MTVTAERAEVLDFTTPYYYTPAGSGGAGGQLDITSLDRSRPGRRSASAAACTYESYLKPQPEHPGYPSTYVVPDDIEIKTYDTDSTAIQDLALGRLDARRCRRSRSCRGRSTRSKPIQLLGEPVFNEPLAVAIDKSAPLDDASLVQAVNEHHRGDARGRDAHGAVDGVVRART